MADDDDDEKHKILADIIAAGYRAVLKRPVDPDGLAAYGRWLKGKPLADAVQQMIESLLKSSEFAGKWTAARALLGVDDNRAFIDTADVEVVMITYNEQDMLPYSLPALSAHFDRFLFVDMYSTDRTPSIISDLLGNRARIVQYRRQLLLEDGYAHARNFASVYAARPWVLSMDADEVLAGGVAAGKIPIDRVAGQSFAVSAQRRNLRPDGWRPGQPIDVRRYPVSETAAKTRLYRPAVGLRWDGYLHEELSGRGIGSQTAKSWLVLDHLSRFKDASRMKEQTLLYSWMLLRIYEHPHLRSGVNPYWYDEHVPKNMQKIRDEAQAFAGSLGERLA